MFTLNGAVVYNESSTCGEGDLEHFFNFNLQPSEERLSLRFKNNNSEITMFVTIRIDPSKHFKDLNQSSKLSVLKDLREVSLTFFNLINTEGVVEVSR